MLALVVRRGKWFLLRIIDNQKIEQIEGQRYVLAAAYPQKIRQYPLYNPAETTIVDMQNQKKKMPLAVARYLYPLPNKDAIAKGVATTKAGVISQTCHRVSEILPNMEMISPVLETHVM